MLNRDGEEAGFEDAWDLLSQMGNANDGCYYDTSKYHVT
jgi:hypothetical protein